MKRTPIVALVIVAAAAGAATAHTMSDGHLELVLVGFQEAGIEIYLGDDTGDWRDRGEPRR